MGFRPGSSPINKSSTPAKHGLSNPLFQIPRNQHTLRMETMLRTCAAPPQPPSNLAAGTPSRRPTNRTADQPPGQTPEQREQREAPGSARGVGPGPLHRSVVVKRIIQRREQLVLPAHGRISSRWRGSCRFRRSGCRRGTGRSRRCEPSGPRHGWRWR